MVACLGDAGPDSAAEGSDDRQDFLHEQSNQGWSKEEVETVEDGDEHDDGDEDDDVVTAAVENCP